jgi:hypothetical protein
MSTEINKEFIELFINSRLSELRKAGIVCHVRNHFGTILISLMTDELTKYHQKEVFLSQEKIVFDFINNLDIKSKILTKDSFFELEIMIYSSKEMQLKVNTIKRLNRISDICKNF